MCTVWFPQALCGGWGKRLAGVHNTYDYTLILIFDVFQLYFAGLALLCDPSSLRGLFPRYGDKLRRDCPPDGLPTCALKRAYIALYQFRLYIHDCIRYILFYRLRRICLSLVAYPLILTVSILKCGLGDGQVCIHSVEGFYLLSQMLLLYKGQTRTWNFHYLL